MNYVTPAATDPRQVEPSALERRRRLAQALIERGTDTSPVQAWTQGLARVANALVGTMEERQIDAEERRAREQGQAASEQLMAALTGAPAPAPMPSTPSPAPAATATATAEPAAGGLEQGRFGDMSLPRGIRNNNPGNLVASAWTQGREGFVDSDGRKGRFATMEDGIRASDDLLQNYGRRGFNTLASVVNRWAPPSENDTAGYTGFVARRTGLDPNAPINFADVNTRARVLDAKFQMENGRSPGVETITAALMGRPGMEVSARNAEGGGFNAVDQQRVDFERTGVPNATQPGLAVVAQAMGPRPATPAQAADPRLGLAMSVINNPFAPPGARAVAQSVVNNALAQERANPVAVAPGSQLVDPRTGRVVFQAPERNEPTPDQRNYEFYVRQEREAGREPQPFGDWKRANSRAGASQVSIDQRGPGEFAKRAAGLSAERFAGIVTQGDEAIGNLEMIAELRRLGDQFRTGATAQIQATLGNFGIKFEGSSAIEAYQALISRLTPQQRVPGSGATSDFDARMFQQSIPRLINTPEGNARVLSLMERLENNKIARSEIASAALSGELTPQEATQRLLALQREARTISTEAGTAAGLLGENGQRREQAPARPAAPQAGQVVDGWRFKGGDPANRANWERAQ